MPGNDSHKLEQALLCAFDGHHVDQIRKALEAGADAVTPIQGNRPISRLLEEYTRSDRLPDCLRLLIEHGAVLEDMAVLPVLLDDAEAVQAAIRDNPSLLHHRVTLTSSFTSLEGATMLHVAAEYGNRRAAKVLIDAGADVNATAAVDDYGLNGHTPLFHTVNSNANRSAPIMHLLLAAGASVDFRVAGIVWGRGYCWETTLFDLTPISYAQCGLLPQFHRDECEIMGNIQLLLQASNRVSPPLANVPNRYLSAPGSH